MFDVDFKLKNETDFTIKVFTMIEGEYAPAVMILKPNEEMLHFKPSIGEISISVMAKRSSEIERLREDRERLQYALMKVCNSLDDNLPAIITKNIALAALGLPLRGMKEGE